MIEKIDLYQKGLHYKKKAMLEGVDPRNDGIFIMQNMLTELNAKLNEVIDAVNVYMPPTVKAPNRVLELLNSQIVREEEIVKDLLERWTNEGEVVFLSQNLPEDAQDLCDVCLMLQVGSDPSQTAKALWQALEASRKRVIIVVPNAFKEQFAKLLARMPYHYEIYEPQPPSDYEVHIIDKEEGNANVERSGENPGREV